MATSLLKNKKLMMVSGILVILLLIAGIIIGNNLSSKAFINSRLKLVRTYLENNDYESAKKLLEEILLKYPNNKTTQDILEKMLQKKYDEALKLVTDYLSNKTDKQLASNNQNNSNSGNTENSKNSGTGSQNSTAKNNTAGENNNSPSQNQTTGQNSDSNTNNQDSQSDSNNSTNQNSQKLDPKTEKYKELVKKGKEELGKKNYQKAREYFEEATKYRDDQYDVYQQLALTYYEMDPGNPENQQKAIEYATKALELKKDDLESILLLAKIYYDTGFYEKAEEYYQKALSLDPSNKKALEGLALTYIAMEKEDKAKAIIEKLYKIDKNNFIANKYLGKWAVEAKDYKNAVQYCAEAYKTNPLDKENIINYIKALYSLKDYAKVIEITEKSLKNEPKYVDEYLFLALSYWKQKNMNKSLSVFSQGLSSTTYYDSTYRYKYFYNYGKILQEAKKYEQAEAMYLKSIEANSAYLLPYEELGALYVNNMKKYKEAVDILEKAIELGGKTYANYYNLGTAYKELGDIQKAIEIYALALAENKKITDVNQRSNNYAKLYTMIGNMIYKQDPARAYEYYKKAMNYASPYIETYSGICDTILKITDFSDNDFLKEIIQKCEQYAKSSISSDLDIKKETGSFYFKVATIYLRMKVFDQSEVNAKKAINLLGNHGPSYDVLIEALIQQKKYNEALTYIDVYLGFASEEKKQELLQKIQEINKLKNS